MSKTKHVYKCYLCENNKWDTKTHHLSHLQSKKHKQNLEIFKLNFEKMTDEQKLKKYNNLDLSKIIKNFITQKKKNNNIIKYIKKENLLKLEWKLDNKNSENNIYNHQKKKLESIIQYCHNICYKESIVSNEAQQDIMKILTLRLSKFAFENKDSFLYKNCLKYKNQIGMSDTDFYYYIDICKNLNLIFNQENDPFEVWRLFVNNFLKNILPSIYYEKDNTFNITKEQTLFNLIKKIYSLEIDSNCIDSYSIIIGDIHQIFKKYSSKKSAKDFGQVFTPFKLIHIIYFGLNLNKIIKDMNIDSNKITVYDPCMGTGGLLNKIYQYEKIESKNIYGCEIELNTIKFAFSSLMLITKNHNFNIFKCDSLWDSPYLNNLKHDLIITNPPFGTNINFDEIKENFINKYGTSEENLFDSIYPINLNHGPSLFVQLCLYKLKINGICIIVLPDGEMFESDKYMEFRKWLLDNVQIISILRCPKHTFDHAGLKTNILIFKKIDINLKNQYNDFKIFSTNKECSNLYYNFSLNYEDIAKSSFNLDFDNYIDSNSTNNSNLIPLNELIEDFSIPANDKLLVDDSIPGPYPFITSSMYLRTHNTYNLDGEFLFHALIGSRLLDSIFYINGKCISSGNVICSKAKNNSDLKYIYHILKVKKSLFNISGCCQDKINKQQYYNISIPYPNNESIRNKIIHDLDKIDESISSIENRIKQLKDDTLYYRYYGELNELNKLFIDSKQYNLNEVCSIKQGEKINSKLGIKKNDIPNSELNLYYPLFYCSIIGYSYLKQWTYDTPGIVINAVNGDGKCEVYYCDDKYNVGKSTIHFESVDNSKYLNEFLYYHLYMNKYIIEEKFKGIDKKQLNQKRFFEIDIKIPSIENQIKSIEIYKKKMKYLNKLKTNKTELNEEINVLLSLKENIINKFCY